MRHPSSEEVLEKQKVMPAPRDLILSYWDVFPNDLPVGLPPPDQTKDLVPGATLVAKPIYRLAQAQSDELKKQLTYLLDHGLI